MMNSTAGREVTGELVEPKSMRNMMNLFRAGHGWIPDEYIAHHVQLAKTELEALQVKFNFVVRHKRMENDGWFDGMRSTVVIIETQLGRVRKLQWHDSSASFFRCCEGGGSARMYDKDLE